MLLPIQRLLVPLINTVGKGTTVTFDTAGVGETQPRELVPVTEYELLLIGLTVLLPLKKV